MASTKIHKMGVNRNALWSNLKLWVEHCCSKCYFQNLWVIIVAPLTRDLETGADLSTHHLSGRRWKPGQGYKHQASSTSCFSLHVPVPLSPCAWALSSNPDSISQPSCLEDSRGPCSSGLPTAAPWRTLKLMCSPSGNVPGAGHPAAPRDPHLGKPLVSLPGEKGREHSRGSLFIPWAPGETKSKESQVHEGRRAPFPATGSGTPCSGSIITLPTHTTYTYQKAKQSLLSVSVALHRTLHPLSCMWKSHADLVFWGASKCPWVQTKGTETWGRSLGVRMPTASPTRTPSGKLQCKAPLRAQVNRATCLLDILTSLFVASKTLKLNIHKEILAILPSLSLNSDHVLHGP